jgi:uncharacterized protein YndB with AHSA1/START domain/uncharacterized protein YciI
MLRLIVLLSILLISCPARAGDRTLHHEVVVRASAERLWEFWTTPEGWKQLGIAHVDIDVRLGGQIRTHYNPQGTLGDDGTITNTILAYEPGRMLAFRPTAPRNAPPPVQEICRTGWSVLRFEPLSAGTTRVSLSMMGFGEGELYDQAYAFFDKGNAYTLEKLKAAFPGADEQRQGAGELLKKLIGEWEHSGTRPDGSVFRTRASVRSIFGGKVLVATGLLGNAESMRHHSHFVASLDPASGQHRLWNWNQAGDVTGGEFSVPAPGTLAFGWDTVVARDARRVAYSGEYIFDGDDAYDCIIYEPAPGEPGGRRQMVKVRYTRCAAGAGTLDVNGGTEGAQLGGKIDIQEEIKKVRAYWLVLLTPGESRAQPAEEVQRIQQGHLEHMFAQKAAGRMVLSGPVLEPSKLSGVCIYNVAEREEVESLVKQDPAVVSGRLNYEILAWGGIPGSSLPENGRPLQR